jgi:hypothetical protein
MPVPNVQWKTLDDGQRNYPKHVELIDKNKFGKISASVGFIKKKFVTMHGHMNVKLHLSLTSDLDGGGWSFLRPGNLRHLTSPRYPLNMRLGGQRSRSWGFGGE